jgi:hypothetical protein
MTVAQQIAGTMPQASRLKTDHTFTHTSSRTASNRWNGLAQRAGPCNGRAAPAAAAAQGCPNFAFLKICCTKPSAEGPHTRVRTRRLAPGSGQKAGRRRAEGVSWFACARSTGVQ